MTHDKTTFKDLMCKIFSYIKLFSCLYCNVNAFENRLDKLWSYHPMKYNPDAEYSPYTRHQDTGSWRSAELQPTDEELNIEASGLRSEST